MPSRPAVTEMLVGFEMGLFSREDLSAWVDAEVERREHVPAALLELTTLRGKHDVEVAHLLRELAPEMPSEELARLEMATLHRLVDERRVRIEQAVDWAPNIAQRISEDDYVEALALQDEHELAVAGVYGDVADVERAFRAFLASNVPARGDRR